VPVAAEDFAPESAGVSGAAGAGSASAAGAAPVADDVAGSAAGGSVAVELPFATTRFACVGSCSVNTSNGTVLPAASRAPIPASIAAANRATLSQVWAGSASRLPMVSQVSVPR